MTKEITFLWDIISLAALFSDAKLKEETFCTRTKHANTPLANSVYKMRDRTGLDAVLMMLLPAN